jgi:mannose PTS system EIIA component
MATILIVAHTPLASALASVARHAYPDCGSKLLSLDVLPEEGPNEVMLRVQAALTQCGTDELLILTDVAGATPHMGAWRAAEGRPKLRLVAGVNVPMLWRSLCYGEESLEQLVARATDGGRLGVVQLASTRPANQSTHNRSHGQDDRHDQQ